MNGERNSPGVFALTCRLLGVSRARLQVDLVRVWLRIWGVNSESSCFALFGYSGSVDSR